MSVIVMHSMHFWWAKLHLGLRMAFNLVYTQEEERKQGLFEEGIFCYCA